ncbi:hypothetical protein [Paenibacillus xylaniclasticus]|uniref:hypothetical protein n=1 Tax=Paenibacillus xylaniclasticus TaxID=588083 RepID=UPI000FDB3F1E|nr:MULTISPECIES: hypothetical protein [Paenibacillus]GFN32424.1 hypothetical protein PCURB6_26840 [Paenibacillus curdlanolyticus]
MDILAKVRSDILVVISKMSFFRQEGDMSNYKTLSDSLLILSGMHRKHLINSESDAGNFFNTVHVKLTDEIVLISRGMEKTIDNADTRMYRDMLISLDKLTNVRSMLTSDFERMRHQKRLPQNDAYRGRLV